LSLIINLKAVALRTLTSITITPLILLTLPFTVTADVPEDTPIEIPGGGSKPHIQLPNSFIVDGRMGTLSTEFPIQTTPGTGNLSPSLSLQYSSHLKGTKFGYGWNNIWI